MNTPAYDEAEADFANASLTPVERDARRFARMIRCHSTGERINFSSADFEQGAVELGIELLRATYVEVTVGPSKGRQRKFDSCACARDSRNYAKTFSPVPKQDA